MPRENIQRLGLQSVLAALVITAVFGLGFFVSSILAGSTNAMSEAEHEMHDHEMHDSGELHHDDGKHDDGEHEEEEHEEDHVALTEQAYQNLQLKMGRVTRGDYWKSLLVPGRVVEIPGQSNLSISASVTGIVEKVNVLPGQTLDAKTALFTIRITDNLLIDAQSKLLELLTRQEVTNQEIERLEPLIAQGAVSGSNARDLQYELRQQKAQEASLLQELATRGMPEASIAQMRQDRRLTTLASVYSHFGKVGNETSQAVEAVFGYSVEDLNVHPGMSVERGDALCTVAYHPTLYVEGTAFQDDLPVLTQIADEGWRVNVETHEHDGHAHSNLELDLLRIDNHVDEATQTVKFFLELPNRVSHTRESDGRRFEQWVYRPGQRLHLRLPVERWVDQITLPADAVVVDGPNVMVFAEHHHDEALEAEVSASGEDDHEHDVFIELEPVPVHLLYRDDKTVVIADDGQLPPDEEIALNNAYKLYLAMQMQAGGGGGHHHHHDH